MSEIIFVRHGQASFGEEDYDKLSQNGHRQAYLLGLKFKDLDFEFDKIICGGMVRHRENIRGITKKILI
ncbi:MAG: histidine phosphatase family protein [Paracoccaceae bacterium]